MNKAELKKLKPLLSPSEFRVVEAMQKSGQWMSYKDINEATGQTCCWKRLSVIDDKHLDFFMNMISVRKCSNETPYRKVFHRKSRWRESLNRFGEVVRFKQFKLV